MTASFTEWDKAGEKYNKELPVEPFVKSDNWDFFDPEAINLTLKMLMLLQVR
jgi:hypothetical protein